jgi:hypothetical protein
MATVVEGLGEVTNDVAQANFQRFIETMSKDQAKDLVRTINTCASGTPHGVLVALMCTDWQYHRAGS